MPLISIWIMITSSRLSSPMLTPLCILCFAVLCRDIVFDRSTDRHGSCTLDYIRESSVCLSGLFRDCCVLDAWLHLHPSTKSFTWSKPDGALSSRIDLIGVPLAWAPFISSCSILPCPFSDHLLVSLSLSIPNVIRRDPGHWKLNVSLLTDDLFHTKVCSFRNTWQRKKCCFSTLSKWWEIGKKKIKRIAIYYGSVKKQERESSRAFSVLWSLISRTVLTRVLSPVLMRT